MVVMPAYNAEKTLRKTVEDIPLEFVDEIILVDDFSSDKTVEIAKSLISKYPLNVIEHKKNIGYGGNQKTCYDYALSKSADIVVMLHPDYQYDPKSIKHLVGLLRKKSFDVVLGSRIRSKKESFEGGMPWYKYYANRTLSQIQNMVTGRSLSEWHTGMRGYKRQVLEKIKYIKFSNDFIFDTEMLFAIVKNNFSIGEISVPVRYFKEASSISLPRSLRYGILTLWETLKFMF